MSPFAIASALALGLTAPLPPDSPAAGVVAPVLKPVVVTAEAGARQPQLAVAPGGQTVVVAFGEGPAIRVAASTDGGAHFGTPVTVATPRTFALGMRRGPRVAATADAVVVAAVCGEQGGGKDGDVLAWRSTDRGATWTGPTRINTVAASAREGLHALAAGPDGTLFCAWLDLRDGKMALYGARSTDGGASWEPDRLVYRSPEGAICTCCHPSVAFGPDGTLHVMWRNDLGGARDLWHTRSRDGGQHFDRAAKLGLRTWVYNKCPMDGGALIPGPDGQVASVWMRAGQVVTASDDRAEQPQGDGVQPWAAPGPKGPHLVWLARRPGALQYRAPGAPAPRTLAESANDPVIASAPDAQGPVLAAWEQPGAGLVTLVLDPGRR